MDNFWSEDTTEKERKAFEESMQNIALNLAGDNPNIGRWQNLMTTVNFRDFIRGLYGIQQGEISMGDDFPSYFSDWNKDRRGSFWDERLMSPQDLLGMLSSYGISEDFLLQNYPKYMYHIEKMRGRALRNSTGEGSLWSRHTDKRNEPTWTHAYGVSPFWVQ